MPLDNITELKRRVPGGKYALARAIAERARQLQGGSTPLTEVRTPNPISVAIDEIVQGKVTFIIATTETTPEENAAIDAARAAEQAGTALDAADTQIGKETADPA